MTITEVLRWDGGGPPAGSDRVSISSHPIDQAGPLWSLKGCYHSK